MLTHAQIWKAVDRLAERHGLSASGLARRAGLDPTTFNRSKRRTADGRMRWPSTESVAKMLAATGASIDDFMQLLDGGRPTGHSIPLIGLAKAGAGGFFDDAGMPVGGAWEEILFPNVADERTYALEITGDSMMPLYRDGDVVVVSPAAPVRRGDRVIVRTREGEVMAKELKRRTAKTVELRSLNPDHPDRVFAESDVVWIARILWASQ
ncbi:MAG TPA: helix-turn-helix transcriptional regulator [Xanthobacteraceae bacterium]|nr:helix-turn-helix transcriptional regulator [Xanthobacteraceae bacterium]